MPTQLYKNAGGRRLPSVTTCLSVLAKPAIIHWAWQLGVEGLDYRKVRDSAGDTGTLVHYLILCDLKNETPDLSAYTAEQLESADASMAKYLDWKKEHCIEPISLETALISERYEYGGTFDFFGKVDDELVLADFKTSKAIYIENCCQLVAYRELLWEHGLCSDRVTPSLKVFQVGKEVGGKLKEYVIPETDTLKYWEMFRAAKTIYNISKAAKLPK